MGITALAVPLIATAIPLPQNAAPCIVTASAQPNPVAAPVTSAAGAATVPPAKTSAPTGTAAPTPPVTPAVEAAAAPTPEPAPAADAANKPLDNTAPDTLATEIIISGRRPSAADPVEKVNEISYQAVQAIDNIAIGPIAHTYQGVVPEPLRDGLHNALDNLDEPIVFVNFVLQLNPGKALETATRFVINSTLGLGGLFDVAKKKPFNLPRRSNGLADTLGYYGVGPGPYLFLPLIGSTSVRDVIGRPLDLSLVPFAVGGIFKNATFATAKSILSALDERSQNDETIKAIHASADPYATMRSWYLRHRQAEIDVLKGLRENADVPVIEPPREKRQAAPSTANMPPDDKSITPVEAGNAPCDSGYSPPPLPNAAPVEPAQG